MLSLPVQHVSEGIEGDRRGKKGEGERFQQKGKDTVKKQKTGK